MRLMGLRERLGERVAGKRFVRVYLNQRQTCRIRGAAATLIRAEVSGQLTGRQLSFAIDDVMSALDDPMDLVEMRGKHADAA